jgi:hypothetical protein
MSKKAEPKTEPTPVLTGVVTVTGVASPFKVGFEYEMNADHATKLIEKGLVELKNK